MKIIIIAAILLLIAVRAEATNFNITFFEGLAPRAQQVGSGTYSLVNGQITVFHAIITGCFNALVECNFNGNSGADPNDGIASDTFFAYTFDLGNPLGAQQNTLDLFEVPSNGAFTHLFSVHTTRSFDPEGSYTVAATPEPSALWLLLAGSLSLLWMKFSRR